MLISSIQYFLKKIGSQNFQKNCSKVTFEELVNSLTEGAYLK